MDGCPLVSHLQGISPGVFQSRQLTLTLGVPAGCLNSRACINNKLSLSFYCQDAGGQKSTHHPARAASSLESYLFSGNFMTNSRGTRALTWYDGGLPRRGSDSDRDVHSGGFVQRGLNHPRHVLLVVSIFWLLRHFLQVGAGEGVHGDTHASARFNLTLALPKVEKQILLNVAQEGRREHLCPDAAPLAGFHRLFFMEIPCRKVTDCGTTY